MCVVIASYNTQKDSRINARPAEHSAHKLQPTAARGSPGFSPDQSRLGGEQAFIRAPQTTVFGNVPVTLTDVNLPFFTWKVISLER